MDHVFKYTNFGLVSLIHGDFFIRQVRNAAGCHHLCNSLTSFKLSYICCCLVALDFSFTYHYLHNIYNLNINGVFFFCHLYYFIPAYIMKYYCCF